MGEVGGIALIEAVIWDLGGVLVRTTDWRYRERWERKLNLQPMELHDVVFESLEGRHAQIGQITPDELWSSIGHRLSLTSEEIAELRADFWRGDQIDHTLKAFIQNLQSEYKTGLLSNAWINLRQRLEQEWGIIHLFDHLTISAEVGIAKPDPAIYELVLTTLDVGPEKAMFIDDTKKNLAPAHNLGMSTVHFNSTAQAIKEIERLLRI